MDTERVITKGLDFEKVITKGLSDDETINSHDIIKSIGYVSLCVSLFLFLTIKIMKYLLARKKFHWKITNSQPTTPNSLTPVLKRSYTP